MSPVFETIRRLGTGGMGDVLLARMRTDRGEEYVALKRMLPQYQEDPDLRLQFEREARVCALLRHKNVVGLRAFGADDQGPYLALEFVDGMSAGELVKVARAHGGALPLDVALTIARDAVRGLDFAHRFRSEKEEVSGVLHRDVSLDNVLVSFTGVSKLADFGVARLIGATKLTRTGTFKGKHGYLGPEIFQGGDVTVATDVFAMGVTVYYLLCGVPPFHGKTDGELMYAVLSAAPPRVSTLRADVPEDLDTWLDAALAKKPSERPDLQSLLAILDRILVDDDTRVRESVGEWVKRASLARPAVTPHRGLPAIEIPSKETLVAQSPTSWKQRRQQLIVGASVVMLLAAGGIIWSSRAGPDPSVATPGSGAVLDAGVTVAEAADASGPFAEADAGLALATAETPKASADAGVTGTAALAPPGGAPDGGAGKVRNTQRGNGPTRPVRPSTVATAPPVEPPLGPGTLTVKCKQWAEVFVDGTNVGRTPLLNFSIKPGPHNVVLTNPEQALSMSEKISIAPGQSLELRYDLKEKRRLE